MGVSIPSPGPGAYTGSLFRGQELWGHLEFCCPVGSFSIPDTYSFDNTFNVFLLILKVLEGFGATTLDCFHILTTSTGI